MVDVGRRLRLRVSAAGRPLEGPPLLLCNGLGASLELWQPVRDALGSWPTVAFDAPGVGGSDVPRYPPTMRGIAGTVAGLLDRLGLERVDVLGVSWGGALAQELARRHPDRVRRLVLAATSPGLIAVPGDPRVLLRMATPLRYWSRPYFERVAPVLYGGEIRQDPALLQGQGWHRSLHQVTARGYLWQLLALRRWTSLPWLHRLAQETLVLAGDRDPIVPLVNAKLLAARIPRADLHVVPGGSHLFLATRADEVVPLITAFLGADAAAADPPRAASCSTRRSTTH
jgi:poly(3-hydroxyalkanoate) depolymerase